MIAAVGPVQHPKVRYGWKGPVAAVRDVPTEILHGVRLTMQYDGAKGSAGFLAVALAVSGPVTQRRGLLGLHLHVGGEFPLAARLGRRTIRVHVGHRVKGAKLRHLVERLSMIPGARDLCIDARRVDLPPDNKAEPQFRYA